VNPYSAIAAAKAARHKNSFGSSIAVGRRQRYSSSPDHFMSTSWAVRVSAFFFQLIVVAF